ncbi:hypothetical protein DFH05DRAFT_1456268 [Lentinula detonsa]|uniref:Uncharacterized protein n=1 Tax=Lentinula detonsa TaxID=2804962 RepID=A0A9W8U4D3_9AGAR|nr:hypothetical protein DFH05DRAFT_1456268 [Lentinula detonsa]
MPTQLEDELSSTIPTPPPPSRRYVSFGRRGGEAGVYTSMPFKRGGVTLATELPIVVQLNTIGDAQRLYHKLKHLFYNENDLPSRDLAQSVLNSTQYEKTMKMFDDSFGPGDICWWVIHGARSGIYTSSVEAFYSMKLERKIDFRFAYGFPSLSGAFNALLNSSSAPPNMVYNPNSNRAVSTEVLKTVMSNLPQIPVHVKSGTDVVPYAARLCAAHDFLIILKKSPEEVEIIESALMRSASLQEFSAQVRDIVPDDIYLGCVWKLFHLEAGADVA